MSVLKKIQKRRDYTLDIDGEPVRLRSMSFDDGLHLDSIEDPATRLYFALGCGLLDDDGKPAFTRNPEESPAQFAARVRESTVDMRPDVMTDLHKTIVKITKSPQPETVLGNSEPTDTPSS